VGERGHTRLGWMEKLEKNMCGAKAKYASGKKMKQRGGGGGSGNQQKGQRSGKRKGPFNTLGKKGRGNVDVASKQGFPVQDKLKRHKPIYQA